jgi:hypothetical protein
MRLEGFRQWKLVLWITFGGLEENRERSSMKQ